MVNPMNEQTNTDQTSVEAEAILASIERKRLAHEQKGTELAAERAAIAFKVHGGDGDPRSRKRLDEINHQLAFHASEAESICAAQKTAAGNLVAAQRAAAAEDDKAAAREVVKVLDELCEHGTVLDDALADAVTAGANLRDCLNRLHNLGISHPSHEMLHTIGNLAFRTAMAKSIWSRYHEAVAPKDRVSFAAVAASWREHLMADVKRRLGGEVKETEAA
jgi:hypothetical protein